MCGGVKVVKVDDKTLRVNVIPHGKADDKPALSTPLTHTGSSEEVDAQLGRHLAGYVQNRQHAALEQRADIAAVLPLIRV